MVRISLELACLSYALPLSPPNQAKLDGSHKTNVLFGGGSDAWCTRHHWIKELHIGNWLVGGYWFEVHKVHLAFLLLHLTLFFLFFQFCFRLILFL